MGDWLIATGEILAGILLLVKGGDRLVIHSARVAVNHRVPKAVVGAVIMGFGTSFPELLVSLDAALIGRPGIAIGNLVGSNIANIGLILGTGALIATLHVQKNVMRAELPLGVLAALFLLIFVGPSERVSRLDGVLLLLGFVFYLWLSLRHTRAHRAATEIPEVRSGSGGDVAWILIALVAIGAGAHLLVTGAVEMARLLSVSETVIGLTMVAFGTSVPELAATVAAARRGETDLAVGNIAGSNLFNILFVLGLTAVVTPIGVEPVMQDRDFPALGVFSVLAFPLLAEARRLRRSQGVILVVLYAAYIAWTWGGR